MTDGGGPTEPAACGPVTGEAIDGNVDDLPVSGLGLALVAAAASRWGYGDAGSGRTVWAEALLAGSRHERSLHALPSAQVHR